MNTALVERPAASVGPVVTNEQMELIRRTVATGATPDELKLYLYDCARRGVHPLDKLLHFTKRGGKYTPITSIDFMRSRAAKTGEMAGSDDAVFHPKPTGADPEKFLPPSAATVTVYRLTQGQRFAYTATARWAEYCPPAGQDHMWKKMPHGQLGKCAEALALRKAFPEELQGLYAREEMDQAGQDRPNGHEAPSEPVNTSTGEVLDAPTDGPLKIESVVELKSGTKNGKAWTLYGITVETGEQVTTFSEQLAQEADDCRKSGQRVNIKWEQKRYGLELTEFQPVAEDIPF